MIAWLQSLSIWHYVIVGSFIIVILILLMILISMLKSFKIKTKDIEISKGSEGKSIDAEKLSVVHHIEVRDYNGLLFQIFDMMKTDIAIRIRRNGWLQIEDFKGYVENAYKTAETTMIQFLDAHYYPFSKVERSELHDWNMKIVPEVKPLFCSMFNRIYDINVKANLKIEAIQKELEHIKSNRICDHNSIEKCYNILDVIRLVTEMQYENHVVVKDNSMIEVNRILKEIHQMFFQHYIVIYKRRLEEIQEEKKND